MIIFKFCIFFLSLICIFVKNNNVSQELMHKLENLSFLFKESETEIDYKNTNSEDISVIFLTPRNKCFENKTLEISVLIEHDIGYTKIFENKIINFEKMSDRDTFYNLEKMTNTKFVLSNNNDEISNPFFIYSNYKVIY